MDEITKDVQGKVLWCMLFANGIILIEESPEEVKVDLRNEGKHLEIND